MDRSYQAENARSRPLPEAKLPWASPVVGWVTTCEPDVTICFCTFGTRLLFAHCKRAGSTFLVQKCLIDSIALNRHRRRGQRFEPNWGSQEAAATFLDASGQLHISSFIFKGRILFYRVDYDIDDAGISSEVACACNCMMVPSEMPLGFSIKRQANQTIWCHYLARATA